MFSGKNIQFNMTTSTLTFFNVITEIKEDEIIWARSMHERSEKFVQILVRKPNVERSFKEPRYRRGENTKIDEF
jgi:hypothetical protein